MTVKGKATPVL